MFDPNPDVERGRVELEGSPGDPVNVGSGFQFRDRCPERTEACEKTPRFREAEDDHTTASHRYYDHEAEPAAPRAPTQAATDRTD